MKTHSHKDRRTSRLLKFAMLAALGFASITALDGARIAATFFQHSQVADGGGEIPTKPPTTPQKPSVIADGGGEIPTKPPSTQNKPSVNIVFLG